MYLYVKVKRKQKDVLLVGEDRDEWNSQEYFLSLIKSIEGK